jgi:hypothetical protein
MKAVAQFDDAIETGRLGPLFEKETFCQQSASAQAFARV